MSAMIETFSEFEWDNNKRLSNVKKHGIDFVDAISVFNDPNQITYRSSHHSSEERHVSVGSMREKLIAVVFTLRGDKLRIISARSARHSEQDRHAQQKEARK
jgi:uncharacterized DUF497 family protein